MSNCKPDYKHAEREALDILHQMGYEEPPINPVEIAKKLGFEVLEAIFERDDVSGMYDYEKKTIYYNHKDAPTRQLFTVAHELGHILLHKEYVSSKEYRVLLRSPHKDDKYELEADAFAANLMMPKFMIDRFKSLGTTKKLASAFCVSLQAMTKRIDSLNRFTNEYDQWY